MNGKLRTLSDWVDDRTGVPTAVRTFLLEDIPASSGWRQVFGSVALFLVMVQAFTGVLLSFNYAAVPADAYASIRYIATQLSGGSLIRGLHHWGASMLIVVVVIHMLQVFLCRAYVRPREATWIAGVVLFGMILAFGLTGYLLPWDNRAYWGTVVTTRIAADLPILGPYLARILGSENTITAATFRRFYVLHILLLPAATMLFVLLHIRLVRRHGVAPSLADHVLPKKPFYPGQVFKDTVAIFITFLLLFGMASFVHVPLEQMADPSDTTYSPRPEWYFLFLFQLLKFFGGQFEIVGTVVLPSSAVLALIVIPFLDRNRVATLKRRALMVCLAGVSVTAWASLTLAAAKTAPNSSSAVDYALPTDWLALPPADLARIALLRGPHTAVSRSEAKLSAMRYAPDFAIAGALVYESHNCGACHQINGVGGSIGPPLNGVSRRRTRTWIEHHFLDPAKLSPGTPMPRYNLAAADMKALTDYLLALEGPE